MALPMLSYVYWKNELSSLRLACINISTLTGTLLGMIAFGFMADKYGRKRMYGVELVLLITATLGVVMSSNGVHDSMNIYAWLIWWRILVGVGVGADYPLSAVITSEYVSLLFPRDLARDLGQGPELTGDSIGSLRLNTGPA